MTGTMNYTIELFDGDFELDYFTNDMEDIEVIFNRYTEFKKGKDKIGDSGQDYYLAII